jgi:hypothetical protein
VQMSMIESIWKGWANPRGKKRTPDNRGPG